MCAICLQSPCHPRCPNAEPDKPVLYCDQCKEPIYVEDDYYHIDFQNLCLDCFLEYADANLKRRACHDE